MIGLIFFCVFLLSIIFFIIDNSVIKLVSISYILQLFLFSISILYIQSRYSRKLFVYGEPTISAYLVIYLILCGISIFITYFLNDFLSLKLKKHPENILCERYEWKSPVLSLLYYLFAIVSLCAFIINFKRVNFSVSNLFLAPREYESEFGRYTVINYLYFLNVPAICLSIFYKNAYCKKIKFSTILNIFLFIISLFHGIKFTIFDTLFIPLFFYLYLNRIQGIKNIKFIVFIVVIGLIVFQVFFLFVRGDTESGLLMNLSSYIIPNYYNFFYFIKSGKMGFSLNSLYNKATAHSFFYQHFSVFGGIIFFPILSSVLFYLYKRRTDSLFVTFFSAYWTYNYFFIFWGFQYTKYKNLYYISIFLLLDFLLKFKITNKFQKQY